MLISSEDLRWNPLQMIFVRILFRGFFYRMIILRGSSWGSSSEDSPVGRSSSEDPCADPLQRIVVTHELERLLVLYHLSSHSSSIHSNWASHNQKQHHHHISEHLQHLPYQDFLHRAVTNIDFHSAGLWREGKFSERYI